MLAGVGKARSCASSGKSTWMRFLVWTGVLQDDKPTVLVKVAVEGNRLVEVESFHHDEAQGIAEGVVLVSVLLQQPDCADLIGASNPLDPEGVGGDHVEEGNRSRPTRTRPHENERVSFDDDGVRRHELPRFLVC